MFPGRTVAAYESIASARLECSEQYVGVSTDVG